MDRSPYTLVQVFSFERLFHKQNQFLLLF